MRFPSAFQAEEGQDERQKTMEGLGVNVVTDFSAAVEGVDGILIEINDPALHLEYFRKAAELNLPLFLDKPMADNLESARKIMRIAEDKNVKAWTSSSLRFTPEIKECKSGISEPVLANVYGPLGQAAKGNSLIWYGIHTFEMLMTLMGRGAESVKASADSAGVVAVVDYGNGKRGIVECNEGAFKYGGRAQNSETVAGFEVKAKSSEILYTSLITAIADFFIKGDIPVSMEDSFEIQAMMDAAVRSLESGSVEDVKSK
jgi:predicted dehydrogenase